MGRKTENTGFICQNCGKEVLPFAKGSIRNHCPFCLHSLHVDVVIGDRRNDCMGVMEPTGIQYHSQKGYQIVHKCRKCGFERVNIISDDLVQPDCMDLVFDMMKRSF